MRATFDTNIADQSDLVQIAKRAGIDLAFVSVSAREVEETSFEAAVAQEESVVETLVLGESPIGRAALGRKTKVPCLERVLQVITSGSFPRKGARTVLSRGERRQLRDAMIFCAHVRGQRDLFVTNDRTAFVDNGRREVFQSEFRTRVMTSAEFRESLVGAPDV